VTDAVVRRAGDADLALVARLRREWTTEQNGDSGDRGDPAGRADPGFEERFEAWWARESPRRITWLAEVDRRPVGMMNLAVFERMPRPGRAASRWGYLGNAFVLALYRNQGIGGLLLSAVLGHARDSHFARVVLSPSERSIPFYQRAGFGSADVLMVWSAANG
jgi:GNAT superfamily N-acetyltransferase